jgi:hypothetical protein
MDSNDVNHYCERLFRLLDRGPGDNPEAKRHVTNIVNTLKPAAPPHAHIKLTELEQWFQHWFSAGWQDLPDLRGTLIGIIAGVEKAWNRRPLASERGDA